MGSRGEYFRVFSLILLIILKSEYMSDIKFEARGTDISSRILLATIKFLGQCPCPYCLVKKTDICKMGMKFDMRRWVTCERIDNLTRRRHIEEARALIFQLGVLVDGAHVKAILNDESYIPIHVSILCTLSHK
jgi:hypothetical protein